MGHTVPIQCPSCRAIQDVELKGIDIDAVKALFSCTFVCNCGYSHTFVDAPVAEVERWISRTSESARGADSPGISAEADASYDWPTDVRSAIDIDRRGLPESQIKRDLRAAALPTPKRFDERWWVVYKLSHVVVFDPRRKTYGLVDADGVIAELGDIASVVSTLVVDR
jgi:hypothetical protein